MTDTATYSQEAEESVLGGLLIDPEAWDDVNEIVGAEDFADHKHKLIFQGIANLVNAGVPVDSLTLAESIEEEDLMLAGGLKAIIDMVSGVPIPKNVRSYASIVRDKAIVRRLSDVCAQTIQELGSTKKTPQELLSEAEANIYSISDSSDDKSGPVGMKSALSSAMDKISELCDTKGGLTGLTTGFEKLNDITHGWQDSDLIIVAGRPSMGKTSFMMNAAEAALLHGTGPVIVFSLEMPNDAVMMRMLAGMARVDQSKLKSGTLTQAELDRIAAANVLLHDKELHIDDTSGLNPSRMKSRIRKIARKHGKPSLIVVDYLGLMAPDRDRGNIVIEIADTTRSMKGFAKEFKCPVMLGCQLNRSLEQRTNKRPIMADLRDSGAIEQDADIVIGLYRDEVYNAGTQDKGVAEAIVLKHRNGEIGTKRLAFLGQYTRFEDLVEEHWSEPPPSDYSGEF